MFKEDKIIKDIMKQILELEEQISYKGESGIASNGIEYKNVEEFLKE